MISQHLRNRFARPNFLKNKISLQVTMHGLWVRPRNVGKSSSVKNKMFAILMAMLIAFFDVRSIFSLWLYIQRTNSKLKLFYKDMLINAFIREDSQKTSRIIANTVSLLRASTFTTVNSRILVN